MRENHRSQTEKKKSNAKRIATVTMLSGAAKAPSSSMTQESSPQTRRSNQSITAAHPAIYRNTRSHKLLRRAIRIWKMPIPILNFTRSLKPKPRSFQERLKMLRNRPKDTMSPNPMARSVRDLQLCSSGTDSSPSPSSSSLKPQRHLRSRPLHRSRRYRKQLQLYRMLSRNRRRRRSHEKQHKLEGQSSPEASTCVKGSSEVQDDHRDSSSIQRSPVIRAPPRRTSRRLWRRQLDSSSSENSPLTPNLVHSERPDTAEDHRPHRAGKTDKKSHSRRVKFSFADVSSESAEFSDINPSAIEEALAPAQRNNNDLKPDEESAQISLKITVPNTEVPEASLDSQLKIFKEELKHCGDPVELKQEPVQFKNPSSEASRNADAPRHKSSVKWKKVMMQRALSSESLEPTHDCWSRFTSADDSGQADLKPEGPEKPAADLIKIQAAGDAFIPQ